MIPYTLVRNKRELQQMVDQLMTVSAFAWDTETNAEAIVPKIKMEVMSLAIKKKNWVIPFKYTPYDLDIDMAIEILTPLFRKKDILKIAHNIKYDMHVIKNHGMSCFNTWDTMVSSFLVDENRHLSLAERSKDCSVEKMGTWKEEYKNLIDTGNWRRYMKYASIDAIASYELWELHKPILEREDLMDVFLNQENKAVRTTFNMERRGIPIDISFLRSLDKAVNELADKALEKVYEEAGEVFNLGSTKQLRRVLFDDLKLPIIKTTGSGAASTDAFVLEKLSSKGYPIAEYILDYREVSKLSSTYTGEKKKANGEQKGMLAFVHEGYLHTQFNSVGARTGRMSSKQPPLQTIPSRSKIGKEIRKAFMTPAPSRTNSLVVADYDQMELKMLAHYSQDPKMLEAYLVENVDLHEKVSREMGIDRKLAKCLTGDSLVFTHRGIQRIQDIIGDDVLGEHRKLPIVSLADGRGGYTTSISGIARENKSCTLVISKRGVLACTDNHRIMTKRGLVRADELREGEELPVGKVPLITDTKPVVLKINPFSKTFGEGPAELILDDQWGYFAGMFLGDGCMMSEHSASISHGTGKEYHNWVSRIRGFLKSLGFNPSTTSDGRNTNFGSRVVTRFLQFLSLGSKKGKSLRVPYWVMEGGRSVICHFLGGLIDTDGTVSKNGPVSVTTKDAEFAGQLCVLFRSLGGHVSLEPCWNKKYERYYYRVHFLSSSLPMVLREFGMMNFHKKKKLKKRVSSLKYSRIPKTDTVQLVLPYGRHTVYDFHVDNDDHLYLQNGLIGHNNLNFGLMYGMGVEKFAMMFKVSIGKAKSYIDAYWRLFAGVPQFKEDLYAYARAHGCSFRLLTGRLCRLPDLRSNDNFKRSLAERQAVNTCIQGGCADYVKNAMNNADADPVLFELQAKVLLQVHDELIFRCPRKYNKEVKKRVEEVMMWQPEGVDLIVPMTVTANSGPNWGTAKD